jgi:hypothetical protein
MAKPTDILELPTLTATQGIATSIMQNGMMKPSSRSHPFSRKGIYELEYLLETLVATPLWPSVGVKPNTPKVGDLESSGTPECLGFDSKAQNTLH